MGGAAGIHFGISCIFMYVIVSRTSCQTNNRTIWYLVGVSLVSQLKIIGGVVKYHNSVSRARSALCAMISDQLVSIIPHHVEPLEEPGCAWLASQGAKQAVAAGAFRALSARYFVGQKVFIVAMEEVGPLSTLRTSCRCGMNSGFGLHWRKLLQSVL